MLILPTLFCTCNCVIALVIGRGSDGDFCEKVDVPIPSPGRFTCSACSRKYAPIPATSATMIIPPTQPINIVDHALRRSGCVRRCGRGGGGTRIPERRTGLS